MKEKKNYLDRLAVHAQLPGEVLPGKTLVEIVGNCRVLIEYHKGLLCYGCNKIIVRSTDGQVIICGSRLVISSMLHHQLVITGTIESVSVGKGGAV